MGRLVKYDHAPLFSPQKCDQIQNVFSVLLGGLIFMLIHLT